MDDTGNVTQDGEEDVDAEVGTAAALEEDTDGREDDGKDDLADVAVVQEGLVSGRSSGRSKAVAMWMGS